MTLNNLAVVIDENAKVTLIEVDDDCNHNILFDGYFCNIPEELKKKEVWSMNEMSEYYKKRHFIRGNRILIALYMD